MPWRFTTVCLPGHEHPAFAHLPEHRKRVPPLACSIACAARPRGRLLISSLPYPSRSELDLLALVPRRPFAHRYLRNRCVHRSGRRCPMRALRSRAARRDVSELRIQDVLAAGHLHSQAVGRDDDKSLGRWARFSAGYGMARHVWCASLRARATPKKEEAAMPILEDLKDSLKERLRLLGRGDRGAEEAPEARESGSTFEATPELSGEPAPASPPGAIRIGASVLNVFRPSEALREQVVASSDGWFGLPMPRASNASGLFGTDHDRPFAGSPSNADAGSLFGSGTCSEPNRGAANPQPLLLKQSSEQPPSPQVPSCIWDETDTQTQDPLF